MLVEGLLTIARGEGVGGVGVGVGVNAKPVPPPTRFAPTSFFSRTAGGKPAAFAPIEGANPLGDDAVAAEIRAIADQLRRERDAGYELLAVTRGVRQARSDRDAEPWLLMRRAGGI